MINLSTISAIRFQGAWTEIVTGSFELCEFEWPGLRTGYTESTRGFTADLAQLEALVSGRLQGCLADIEAVRHGEVTHDRVIEPEPLPEADPEFQVGDQVRNMLGTVGRVIALDSDRSELLVRVTGQSVIQAQWVPAHRCTLIQHQVPDKG